MATRKGRVGQLYNKTEIFNPSAYRENNERYDKYEPSGLGAVCSTSN